MKQTTMQIKRCAFKIILLLVFICLYMPNHGAADESRDNNANINPPNYGLSEIQVQIRHRVIIPQIIYFRIGSADMGEIDEVKFDLTDGLGLTPGTSPYDGSDLPLGDSTPVEATSNGTLFVDLRANIGTVELSYSISNSSGLSDGSGHFIAFDEIETQSDDSDFPAPTLSNNPSGSGGTVNITGNSYGGRVVNRQAEWTYRYKNQTIPVAGTYTGRVTYTASAP